MHRRLVLAAAAVAALALMAGPRVSAQGDAEVRQKFGEGIRLFEQGRFDEAYAAFEEALARDPSADLALELRDEAGYALFVEMLASEHEGLPSVARKLLRLAEQAEQKDRADPTRIRNLLDELRSSDFRTQYLAREKIIATVGHYVVPFAVDALGDRREEEYRVRVIDLLVAMSSDAVLPVIELLDSPDSYTQQNAAVVLGHIRDWRAVAPLKALTELPGVSSHVVDEARTSLRKVTGEDPGRLKAAKEYFLADAKRYYLDDATIVVNRYKECVVWKWTDGELKSRVVPRYAYNDELAEECCYDGLATDPAYEPLWAQLLGVHYAQLAEVETILEVSQDRRDAGAEVPPEAITELEEAEHRLSKVRAINYSRGRLLLYQTVAMAMADGMGPVAVKAIEAIRDLKVDIDADLPGGRSARSPLPPPDEGEGGDAPTRRRRVRRPAEEPAEPPAESEPAGPEPAPRPEARPDPGEAPRPQPRPVAPPSRGVAPAQPLVDALQYEDDKRVRYAAAECLAALSPRRSFSDSELVVTNLIDALGESGPRVVLVIENDINVRNKMLGLLRDLKYLALGAETGAAGIARARAFPSEDCIIVSEGLSRRDERDVMAFDIIEALHEDYRTQTIPVVVLTDRKSMRRVQAAYADKAQQVIADDIDRAGLGSILNEVFDTDAFRRDAKARSVKVARAGAEALAGMDPEHPVFAPRTAVPALVDAIQRTPDEVRIPAMHALGRLQDRQAVPALVRIFEEASNSRAARIAAADAMGEVIKADGSIPPSAYSALTAGLSEKDRGINEAAGAALGKATLQPNSCLDIFKKERIE
ncbi:MAG: HEAT repeat domain-containing protein [Planctomycetes bacterium]|nr:HEAT repeat domain-containing protein [Planctomycetota bacterium]